MGSKKSQNVSWARWVALTDAFRLIGLFRLNRLRLLFSIVLAAKISEAYTFRRFRRIGRILLDLKSSLRVCFFKIAEEGKIIDLQVVRIEPNRGGRPLFFTARTFIRICRWIEEGHSAAEACRMEGVTYALFRKRVTQYPSFRRRLREAEEIREHFLREFHIANILKHSAKNVAASMFWLERRYPNEFALKTVSRDSAQMEQQALCDKISLEQLVANARLAAEIAANPPPGLREPDQTEAVGVE
jgi:hypothetical protein